MANPCKDILLDSGFSSLDADHLLDAIRFSNKSLDELTADLEFKQNKKDFIPTQADYDHADAWLLLSGSYVV